MKLFFFFLFLLSTSLALFSQVGKASFKNPKDTVWLINSKSNTLYAGIDNYLEINRKFLPYKNMFVEITRGMVMEDGAFFIAMVGRPGNYKMNVYQFDNGDTSIVFSKTFSAISVPEPYISVNGENIAKAGTISFQQLCKKDCFNVKISEDLVDQDSWYEIKSITVGYSFGKVYVTKTCEGRYISSEVLYEIKRLSRGKEIDLVFTLSGTGDIFKRTDPIRLKLD